MRMIVTGAASGIGRSVALLAAEDMGAEARLLLFDMDGDKLKETAHLVEAKGARAIMVKGDVTKPDQCADAVAMTEREFGGIDTLVSNAGIVRSAPLLDLDVETFDLLFRVNTRPVWLFAKAAHRALAASKGSIVATASIAADNPTPPLATYSASKAALVTLVRQMALEWGGDGIRCNCVSPGPTYTGMTKNAYNDANDPVQLTNRRRREASVPLGKLAQPEEVARVILFLASPAASHLTGINIPVDGGQTAALMPSSGGGQGHGDKKG